MKTWRSALFLAAMAALLLTSCKRTYFHVTEEVHENKKLKFTTSQACFESDQQILLTGGAYRIEHGENTVVLVEGKATLTGVGEPGVAMLDFGETARFYIALPQPARVARYDIAHNAICEIISNYKYRVGETLFTCQSGEVVLDSLKRGRIYGRFAGEFLNTANQRLSVEGDLKAKRR